MALSASLTYEVSASTGTGDFTVSGVNGYKTLNTSFGTGGAANQFWYFISNTAANQWEIGTGHLSAANTLVRDTVADGTSGPGVPVNFSGGVKNVTSALPYSALVNVTEQQVARSVLASPTASSGVPSFRTLVAADTPQVLPLTGGTLSNILTVRNSTATGFVQLVYGTSANIPGYLGFFTQDDVRRGYVGWASGTNLQLQAEAGWGWHIFGSSLSVFPPAVFDAAVTHSSATTFVGAAAFNGANTFGGAVTFNNTTLFQSINNFSNQTNFNSNTTAIGGGTFDGPGDGSGARYDFRSSDNGVMNSATSGKGILQVYSVSSAAGDTFMCFHLGGLYASYFGVRAGLSGYWYGGWSEGAAAYQFHDTKGNGAASQAEMETPVSGAVFVSPFNMKWHLGMPKVWATGNYAGSATAGYNISSVTHPVAGSQIYNYSVTVNTGTNAGIVTGLRYSGTGSTATIAVRVSETTPPTTTSVTIITIQNDGDPQDGVLSYICVFGDI